LAPGTITRPTERSRGGAGDVGATSAGGADAGADAT